MMLISIAFALIVVEITLRNFQPIYTVGIPWGQQYDPERGFILAPNTHLFRLTDFEQERRINQLGTSNFQDNFAGYEKLVFAVGDSFTEGMGVAADMSYPFNLDLTLNRDDRGFYVKRYGVVNLGVGGYGGEQSLLATRAAAAKIGRPAVILYMGSDNDFADDLMFRAGNKHGGLISGGRRWGWLHRGVRWFKNETQIGGQLSRRLYERRQERLITEVHEESVSDAKVKSIAELETEQLEKFYALAREYGALLVVTWADEGRSYEWLRSWAASKGVTFADWAAATNSVRAAVPSLPLDNFHSGKHHRAWVNRVIAEEFARYIRANQK